MKKPKPTSEYDMKINILTQTIDNSPIERVEEFKYFGTTLTNQNSIQEEIKSRLKLGNACYYSVQNLLSSSLLSKKLKITTYRTVVHIHALIECILNLGYLVVFRQT